MSEDEVTTDLATWYLAQLDEIEAIASHDPATVLADIEVKRQIVELHAANHAGVCETCMDTEPLAAGDCGGADAPCETVRLLAYGLRHRSGYREEWAPGGVRK